MSTAVDRLIGQSVGSYRVERVLGRGGMGAVYVVRHIELGSAAALKTLLPGKAERPGEESHARFLNEARALSMVTDEGLVRIFDFGYLPDLTPYIIMELLHGQTLRQLLLEAPGQRLSSEDALALIEQAAGTLDVLHRHGVIHRDIKPENIMLVPDKVAPGGRRVKLLDFGIAKLVEPQAPTLTQEPLGTPLYMSPEVCRNETVSPQADVYALGCVLYEALCGRTPYVSGSSNLLLQHIFNTPEPVRAHASGVPIAVQALTMQMLAREPAARPTMAEVAALAQGLRLHPQKLYGTRIYWGLLGLRHRRAGKFLALGLGMLFALLAVAFITLANGSASLWLDRLLPRSWRAPLVHVPGGRFTMGSTDEEVTIAREMVEWFAKKAPSQAQRYYSDYLSSPRNYFAREQPISDLNVPGFEMERHEVTNEQFVEFLNHQNNNNLIFVENKCPVSGKPGVYASDSTCLYLKATNAIYGNLFRSPFYGGIEYSNSRFSVPDTAKHRPAVAMTWQAASDYCRWRYGPRGRLPTEVEWEYAARRGGRRFPWGNELPDCAHAVIERCGMKRAYCHCEPKDGQSYLPDIGSAPLDRTYDGIIDLAGSVSEWTNDWFHARWLSDEVPSRLVLGQRESQAPNERGTRIIRGGAWTQDFLSTRATARFGSVADRPQVDVGLRCVRELPTANPD